jgi:hypothetical protein
LKVLYPDYQVMVTDIMYKREEEIKKEMKGGDNVSDDDIMAPYKS